MADFVTLTCPSCGGKLQITDDIDQFACNQCGNEHVVRRSGGIVSLAPVVDEIIKVQSGVDKTASELAIKRLESEIFALEQNRTNIMWESSRYLTTPNGCLILLIGFMVIAVIFNLSTGELNLAEVNFGMAIGYLVELGIFILLWRWIRVKRRRRKAEANEQCDLIDQELSEKRQELIRHKETVSMI